MLSLLWLKCRGSVCLSGRPYLFVGCKLLKWGCSERRTRGSWIQCRFLRLTFIFQPLENQNRSSRVPARPHPHPELGRERDEHLPDQSQLAALKSGVDIVMIWDCDRDLNRAPLMTFCPQLHRTTADSVKSFINYYLLLFIYWDTQTTQEHDINDRHPFWYEL